MEATEDLKELKTIKPSNFVQTIERVATLLDILAESPQGLSVGELSTKVQLPKGTVHRLLTSLCYIGFVRQDSITRYYQLGFKLMELGNVLLSYIDLRNEARPSLLSLADQVEETIHLVVQDREEVIYIDKVEPLRKKSGLQMVSRLGTRIPMHCCSVGKVILAHLPANEVENILSIRGLPRRTRNTICDKSELIEHLKRIRTLGFAIDNEENEKGIRCVASSIRDITGNIVAAVSISAPAARVTLKMLKTEFREKICNTAVTISKKLGYSGN
jgi:DNA-binding IclR family transcriptional regulator